MEHGQVANLISTFSYPAVFLLTLGAGLGLPVSEELVFFLGGMMAAKGGADFWGVTVSAALGTLGGDLFLFRMGRSLGPSTEKWPRLARVLTPERMEKISGYFRRFGSKTVFLAGFVAGLRFPTFIMAGASGMPLRRFLAADCLAIALFAPSMTFLGFRFGHPAWQKLKEFSDWLLPLALLTLMGMVALYLRRRRRLSENS